MSNILPPANVLSFPSTSSFQPVFPNGVHKKQHQSQQPSYYSASYFGMHPLVKSERAFSTKKKLENSKLTCSLQKHRPPRKHPRLAPRHSITKLVQIVFLLSFCTRGRRGLHSHATAIQHRNNHLCVNLGSCVVELLLRRYERPRVDRV
jgi:hypothetical protein